MIDNILSFANNVTLDRVTNLQEAISLSGFERRVRSGPTFYNFRIDLPLLYPQQYKAVESDLFTIKDGLIASDNINIPSRFNILTSNHNIEASGVITIDTTATGTVANRNSLIKLDGVTSTSYVSAGDYFQFGLDFGEVRTSFKLYQIKADSNATGNSITFELNQPFLTEAKLGEGFVFGNDCKLKLILDQRPINKIIPGPNYNYNEFNTFSFNEVL